MCGVSGLAAEQAFAQDVGAGQASVVDEVIVTAQKREQRLKDVPISIVAFGAEALDRENLTDFERLSLRTPGFFVQQQTDSSASFVMRGVEAASAGAASEPGISFFLNDVDTSRSRGALKELFDIERVEIAKGPQGALYGRGSQTGAIAVYTRRADPSETAWSMEGQLGNYNLYGVTGVLNVPIVQDELGLRVAVRRRERDGYARNIVDGRMLNDDDLWAARASLRWLATPNAFFDLIIDHQTDADAAAMTKGINIASPGGDTNPFSDAAQNYYDPPQHRSQTGATLIGQWDVNDAWSVRSISAWRKVDFEESWDIDGTSYEFAIGRNLADDQKILSQELRLNYDDGGRFRTAFGVSYYNDKTYNLVDLTLNEQLLLAGFPKATTPVTRLQVAPAVFLPVTKGVTNLNSTRNDRDSWSAYGNVSYDLAPRLTLDVGLRYTYDQATVSNSARVSTIDGVAPIALPNGLGNSFGQAFSNTGEYNLVQPRASVTWRVTDAVNAYAGVSRGLRSGYPQVSFAAPLAGSARPIYSELKTEEIVNYEIGAKGNLGRNLYFEAAAFTYDYNDFQTRAIDITVGTVNAGKASAYGLETNTTWRVSPDLKLTAAYAYLHSQYDEFYEVVGGVLTDRSGNVFRMAPKHTASIGADWRRPVASGWEVFANGNYAWRSKFYMNNDNLETEMQKAFGLFDLRVGVERQDGLRIELYGENLFDQDWVRDVGNGGKSFGVPTAIRANPRFFGLRFRIEG